MSGTSQEIPYDSFSGTAAVPIAALLLMLCFPSLSVQGAADGLRLWFDVVLPTLAPFMICTQAIVAMGGMGLLMKPFYPLLHFLFGLSVPGSYVLLCGLLCGYPLGARLCADFLRDGNISREEGKYLFAICNHPSPMFLMGYVRGQLPVKVSPVLLLVCLYLPVLPLSWIAGRLYHWGATKNPAASNPQMAPGQTSLGQISPGKTSPGKIASGQRTSDQTNGNPVSRSSSARSQVSSRRSLEDILMSTCDTIVMIGGYMMLFSILSAWVRRIPSMPGGLQAMITGLAEITTGVHQVCVTFPARQALLPCILTVSFGGLSGIFQTRGVTKNAGLSIRHYVGWKALHACLSGICLVLLSMAMP